MSFDLSVLSGYWTVFLDGLADTVWLCGAGAVMSGLLGMALMLAQRHGGKWFAAAVRAYTAITLGLPLLVLLYLMFFVLPEFGVLLPSRLVGTLTLAIYYGPYVAQVLQAAVAAIPVGTVEAGIALGIAPFALMRYIVLPQALPLMLPTLTGLMIGLVKDSALLSVISVHEFMFSAKSVVSSTYAPLEVYVVVALVYWAASSFIHFLGRRWEDLLGRSQRPGVLR